MEEKKNILVLGANGGLGSSVCRLLSSHNYKLILAGRNKAGLESLADELESPYIVCDATEIQISFRRRKGRVQGGL